MNKTNGGQHIEFVAYWKKGGQLLKPKKIGREMAGQWKDHKWETTGEIIVGEI